MSAVAGASAAGLQGAGRRMGRARELLAATFGFERFREGQEEVVGRLLDGRSVVAIFPTGAGKSLCYQLPALVFDGLTLVVSPLIALMKDQLDFLARRGVPAARLDSTLLPGEVRRVHDDLRGGRLKLLYVAPERFASERFVKQIGRRPISLLAIDEAHCISEWGHNFRPDYMKLAGLARSLAVERVLALTATATPAVARDIADAFAVRPDDVVRTGFHRPNLHLGITPVSREERDELLVGRLEARGRGPTIVYVTLQRTAEQVAAGLAAAGFPARCYHAGLDADVRTAVQDWFMASPDGVVVATIAFGMGIDKADIRAVYHYNLPKSLESYAQEIGRAGRDGRPARCEVLALGDDVIPLENFSHGDTPTRAGLAGIVAAALAEPVVALAPHDLAARHDVRPLVLDTVLTYLELEGVLAATGPFYSEYKVQWRTPAAEVRAQLDEQERDLLDALLARSRTARIWTTIDVVGAAEAAGVTRERMVALIGQLEEAGQATVQTAGLRLGFRRLERVIDQDALVDRLLQRFAEREQRDIERIGQVVALGDGGCVTARLLAHFGEPAEPCGHCAVCDGERGERIRVPSGGLDAEERALVGEVVAEDHRPLGEPRPLARFLCGIASPAATRAGLSRDGRFGALGHRRFAAVLAAAERALGG